MKIEHLIEKERWGDARAMLREAIKKEPEHHWAPGVSRAR
jgi:hypothetical protein